MTAGRECCGACDQGRRPCRDPNACDRDSASWRVRIAHYCDVAMVVLAGIFVALIAFGRV